ncbi:MAG TPA: molybdopterin-binding protein [Gaiellaceae bacterium]|jgi:molybdenum cofactor synthesis domain-containing protein|nr:molybdopterin-binding protein [Gaiellaceae bacterium]
MATGSIVTIGNELVSGDVGNTNGSWLAGRLEALGLDVVMVAAVPDDEERVAAFVRSQVEAADVVVVTGGLGGTPDDITREAIAAAFGVPQEEQADVAERLRSRFRGDPAYVTRWAHLPAGSRALENPLGGAPGFVLGNVYVLPGLPAEMEAMFETVAEELRRGTPIGSWRRTYRTTESRIVAVLEAAGEQHPAVRIGSYPTFGADGSTVELVLKSSDPEALAAATAWLEQALDELD